MKKKSLIIILCLVFCGIIAGCGKSTADEPSEKIEEEESEEKDKEVKKKEKKKKEKKEKAEKKEEFDTEAAEASLKEMSDSLTGFLWASMMKENDYDVSETKEVMIPFTDEEKIRAAVFASDEDYEIDSTFVLGMGGFSEDKTAETGPDGDGFHGISVSKKDVEQNCLDLFGTEASWDYLPVGPMCDLFDAVSYEKGDDVYALIVDREIETETDIENHECTFVEEDGKYIGRVNMFWGYWGELDQNPGYSNYVAEYTLEPDENSKYGMVIKEICITAVESDEDPGDAEIQDGFGTFDEPFYGVWVGASKEKQESVDLVDDLNAKGLDAYCIYTPEWENLNSDSYWCVTVGKSATKESAQELIADVESAGYKGAYVKYTGLRLSHRIYYYQYVAGDAKITPSKVTLDVDTEEMSGTGYDEGPMTLIVDSDTVFDAACDMQAFPGYKKGDSPLEWFNSADPQDTVGVFEVSIEGNHVERFYGSYWWD
ncbi:MAG: SPOR domain-containing protein [Lachnospiraceae bacterium]|nr:SPOR domain-containing protein [Lachnospiraceae bacterium]